MESTVETIGTRDRILQAAEALFFRQGYQATVVNQIIEEAGISKPTFYAHFPSKEALCTEYLREMRKRDTEGFRERIRRQKDPFQKFMTPIRGVREQLVSSGYRGCGYFNLLSEVVNRESPIVREVVYFTQAFRELLRDVTEELIRSDPRYARLNVAEVADEYYVLLSGAIMTSQEFHDEWPIDVAIRSIERLVA